MIQIAQYISSRVQYKKRSRSGLRRGFLCCAIGEIDKSRCVSYFPTVPYYEAYEERFGVRKESAQGNPTISSVLAIIIQKVYMPLMFRQLMKEMLLHSKRYWK